ncbi:MAG: pyroglutamyl-peptidase I [Planctomycetes bacterium]|nr:pyroglutamyl-peptidase I [Planctomycetota bacterium]
MAAPLLLTGFDAFGNFKENPSWEALKFANARGMFAGVAVAIEKIPVTYGGAFEAFERAVKAHNPVACVSFGVHGGLGREAQTICLERTARNRDGASKADNAGVVRAEQTIVAAGPETLPSALPLERLRKALADAGYAVEVSNDAGKYLCNHLFYRAAHALRGRIAYGFVHVPPVKGGGGEMTLERLAQAVVLIAAEVAGMPAS